VASYNKFNAFVQHLMNKEHDLFGTTETTKVYLSNATPDAELDAVKADLAEISAGNGYSAGGNDTQNDSTRSTTTVTLTGVSLTITASGGQIGPFQYVVHYNDTPSSPNIDPLINWWNYGSAVTLNDGESFSIKFNNAAVGVAGTIFTLA
jgi:hypothetical protein